ncbi:SanA/YdcF family protein [Cerasicoccus fimbriatus]|uniref:SanA/YdcF family protein n=1 Tax=Cerasicoccus fimbriatus TaxID=3014554 RepID=UPI0022B4919A|nr:ElyC/SanA/YdcF family protein [Cerasicoccus sp. TK19100]
MIDRARIKLWTRRLLLAGVLGGALATGLIFYARYVVQGAAAERIASNVDAVQPSEVALVLGTSPELSDGRPNLYFEHRMDAAAELYHAGKVERLLVSGSNPNHFYDESTAMKLALIKRGVPKDNIARDYAGFRTLDSVVRAKEIFGCDEVIIVSQPFHIERAIYIAEHHGLEATGFAAQDVSYAVGFKTQVREQLARVKAVLDIHVLNTEPKFLGKEIYLATAD